jgi:DNA-binding transcriptional LysR family regulator
VSKKRHPLLQGRANHRKGLVLIDRRPVCPGEVHAAEAETRHLELAVRAAVDGAGLVMSFEAHVAPHIASGALVRVLEDWCPPHPGFFLNYPTREQQPPALTALIDTLRL